MTDHGFFVRGYRPVNADHDGYPRFTKFFTKNNVTKYNIIVTKYPLHMQNDRLYCGVVPSQYECEVIFMKPGTQNKPICINFSYKWRIDEVEEYVEEVYASGLVSPQRYH